MKNCLVLLTKVFPFDKGEEFIEGEIELLSQTFDKIILILWVISEFNGYGQNYQIICKGEDRAIAP